MRHSSDLTRTGVVASLYPFPAAVGNVEGGD